LISTKCSMWLNVKLALRAVVKATSSPLPTSTPVVLENLVGLGGAPLSVPLGIFSRTEGGCGVQPEVSKEQSELQANVPLR